MRNYSAYLCFGDSMSIDYYPAIDCGRSSDAPVGAGALLYSNVDELYPEMSGKDLLSHNPDLRFGNLAVDGATTWDLLDLDEHDSLLRPFHGGRVIITLTIGGNDFLQLLASESTSPSKLTTDVAGMLERFKKNVGNLQQKFPDSTILLNSIYDPSDGSGVLPGRKSFLDKLPFLLYFNEQIRRFAVQGNFLFADIHQHFYGHGLSAAADKRFYWAPNPIEPSALGASELRSLWLATISSAGILT